MSLFNAGDRDRYLGYLSVSSSESIHTKVIALCMPIRAHGNPITSASN